LSVRWACIALWLCACSRPPGANSAFIRVVVAAQTSSAEITRVSVTVTPANASEDLTRDPAGTFSGTLSVPVGVQTVTASAWAGTTLAGSGSGSVTVTKGQTAQLFIAALDTTGPAPLPDHSPVVTSLAASATAVALGDHVSLVATAVDADGDAISFGWSAAPAGCGTFATPGSASTTWTAATVGICAVTLTASARGRSDSRSTSILVSPGAGAPTPTLVQHLSSTSSPVGLGEPGNHFKFTLPNPVLAGNCLILGIAHLSSATFAATPITDGNGNTWPTTPAATSVDANGNVDLAIFVLPDANAGITSITVHFTAALNPFQYTVSEFNNIATSSPFNGSSANSDVAAPNLTSGSFTPGNNDANGGNLIWTLAWNDGFAASGNKVTGFTAGTNFTLLDADIGWNKDDNAHHASQYFVQATSAAINPGMTVTMSPANDPFVLLSIALKAATAGTVPAATGIRIVRINHNTIGTPSTLSPANVYPLQFPCIGNLLVLVTSEVGIIQITSVTDSKGNTWVQYDPPHDTTTPQFWVAANATPDTALTLSVNFSGAPNGFSTQLYDIIGADPSPVDVAVGVTGANDPSGANVSNQPTITPTTTNGLTIAALTLGTGPSSGFDTGAPAGAIFDFVYNVGQTDRQAMDNSDGRAHYYNPDLATEHWNWVIANGTNAPCAGIPPGPGCDTPYASTAVHFKAAATTVAGTAP
jgi:hypothetical protein